MENSSESITTFYVVNVKLKSNSRSGTQSYIDLFEELFKSKIHVKYWGDRHYILRTLFHYDVEGGTILGGKLSSFSVLDTTKWLDLKDLDVVQYEISTDHFPNHKETNYYFIPQAHRFCIEAKDGFSVKKIEAFLQTALSAIIGTEEQIEVIYEKSLSGIDEILKARQIRKIEISISYSNQDTNEESIEFADNLLKRAQVGKAVMVLTPDQNKTMSGNSKFIKGFVGLTKSNGKTKATIIDENDERKEIETSEYPKKVKISHENDDEQPSSVYKRIMSIFRP